MIYLYLGKNTIKLLSLSKSLLGQYSLSHFSKAYSTDLLAEGRISSTDVVASSIREALTSAQPTPISDKDVTLILPQEAFQFARYTVPSDITESAIEPFVKDKVRTQLHFDIQTDNFDYLVRSMANESTLFFYGQKKELTDEFKQVFQLLQLNVKKIIPETLSFYTLFEKTLRMDKKENILYAAYKNDNSFGYMYDTLGLVSDEKYHYTKEIKAELKKQVSEFNEKNEGKVNRLILSGSQSTQVRQDLFTKDVGAWTNPLEKIIDNFYQDYLKMLVPNETISFPVLQFDVCFGAFIFEKENETFTLLKQGNNGSKLSLRRSGNGTSQGSTGNGMPGRMMKEIFNLRSFITFAISLVIAFGVVFGFMKFQTGGLSISMKKDEPKREETQPTVEPTKTPTPTPSINREELQIKILNGSGTPGKAGELQDILQEAGYSDIVTGNADTFDYETTEIQLNADSKDALSFLQKDLADYLTIKEAGDVPDDETADVIIIIGTDFE